MVDRSDLTQLPEYDTVAVGIVPDRYGTFAAKRFYLKAGVVVHESIIVDQRPRGTCLRECRMDLDLISLQLSRQVLVLGTQ